MNDNAPFEFIQAQSPSPSSSLAERLDNHSERVPDGQSRPHGLQAGLMRLPRGPKPREEPPRDDLSRDVTAENKPEQPVERAPALRSGDPRD